LNFVTDVKHIFDACNTLAIAEFRNMHQAIATRQNIYERTKSRSVNHATCVNSAEFCSWWINNRQDARFRIFDFRIVW
jgi:hypothetical protein